MGGGDNATPPTGGGLLEQAQNAIAQRKALLDNAGAPTPVPIPIAPQAAPKGIRPNFVALDPKEWTPEERAQFKAQNAKPGLLQQIMKSLK